LVNFLRLKAQNLIADIALEAFPATYFRINF